ncbi:MAG: hypothetical protein DVB22_000141 [Verrucomicrobia bacterium]|nr:MAG: hypothetical protein DVB22_000141 [Verrucomicrobiota bacterium]
MVTSLLITFLSMPDEFDKWKRLQDRQGITDKFVTKPRHAQRYRGPKPPSQARLEAQRDRIIFLVVMGILVTVAAIVVFGFIRSRTTG